MNNNLDMKSKILAALKDMSTKVERDSKHIYHEPFSGEKYQGVSTVAGITPKDWLAMWGAKECAKFLGYSDYGETKVAEEMRGKIIACTTIEEYIEILKEAKGASSRKSKSALDAGKIGHKWLEDYIDSKMNATPMPVVPTGMLERPIRQWLEWESANVKEWIASEGLIVYPEKKYAGQFDAIAMMQNGFLALVDFKFATNLSPDYWLQTAGYCAAFEPYGISFDERIIIRLPKTEEKEERDEVTWKYTKIPNNMEVETVPTKYEVDRDAFFQILQVKSWINYTSKLAANNKKQHALKPFDSKTKEKSNPSLIPF